MKCKIITGFLIVVTVSFDLISGAPPNVVEMKENEKLVGQIAPAADGEKANPAERGVAGQMDAPAPKEKIDVKKPEKILPVDDLKPPDHLDAVKLEQDGMINKDYKKEIFLGNHEEIEDDNYEVAESKLRDIFSK